MKTKIQKKLRLASRLSFSEDDIIIIIIIIMPFFLPFDLYCVLRMIQREEKKKMLGVVKDIGFKAMDANLFYFRR